MRADNLNAIFSDDKIKLTRGDFSGFSAGDRIIIDYAGKNSVLRQKRAAFAHPDDIVSAVIVSLDHTVARVLCHNNQGKRLKFITDISYYICITKEDEL